MGSYRKKPVVIEAQEFNGTEESVAQFIPMDLFEYRKYDRVNSNHYPPTLVINTLEGNMIAQVGDYIIKGVNGEFYPCKPDIFAKTYDQVDAPQCTAPQDPDHVLTDDEAKRLNETGSLCDCAKDIVISGETSDGYHTFNELYYHRMVLFSIICNNNKEVAFKSKLHADGTMFDDYFIVGVNTANGYYTYHYHMDDWGMFDVEEVEKAPEWDGHKPSDIRRLLTL